MKKVRFGVLGVAKIAVDKVIPAMQRGARCQVTAIASRTLARAQQAAQSLGLPQAYGSYDELLADPEIDAIYNPLPNHLHVPWSIRALEAGKHVLCEKPIALNVAEAQQLVAAGQRHPHLKLMEAFMYRHHPQWVRTRQLVQEGRIDRLRSIDCLFSYHNVDPKNVRNQAEIGGGGLWDIGCYPVSVSRFLFGRMPRRVVGWVEYDPQFGTDRLATALLDFESGTATFTCSTQLVPYQRVQVLGTAGRIEVEIPFNAPTTQPCRIWCQHGTQVEEILLPVADQYTVQGDLFAQAVLENGAVPTPIADAVENMRVLEAIVESARASCWIDLQ